MSLAGAIRLLLAAALLVASQVSLLHPLEHHDTRGGFVHLAGGHGDPGSQGSSDPLCDVIAAVGACVGGTPPPSLAVVAASDSLPDSSGSRARSAPLLAYRSQAPPSRL